MAGIPREQLLKELLPGLNELFGKEFEKYEAEQMAEKMYVVRVRQENEKWFVFTSGDPVGIEAVYPSFEDLPEWIQEKVGVLQIAEDNTDIAGLGYKSAFGYYYLTENKNENSNV